ncbi:SHOCT domain-containing protein, partial [[Mycobacterium] crassicus]
ATPSALREITLVAAQSGTVAAATGATEIPFAEMAMAGMAGRGMTATAGGPGPGLRPPMTTQPNPAAPPKPAEESRVAPEPVTGVEILAELRGLAELRDAGVLTTEEFDKQRERVIADFIDE